MNTLAIDCEATGLDLFTGARPFLVTICDGEGTKYFEWPVNPTTRQPIVPEKDLIEIDNTILFADYLVGQNIKFDASALALLFQDHDMILNWPWERTYDTLIAGHLLASNQPHDLTSMAIHYLGEDITKYEEAVKKATVKARFLAKHDFPNWSLASKTNPQTPSTKGSAWGADMWLPRAMAEKCNYSESHPFWNVVADYANVDSSTTWYLWQHVEKEIKRRELWKIFQERMKLVPIAMELESRGVTLSKERLERLIERCQEESADLATTCVNIARSYDYDLELPKSGNNQSLARFCFGNYTLDCKNCGYSKTVSRVERLRLSDGPIPTCPSCFEQPINFTNEGCISNIEIPLTPSKHEYLSLQGTKWSAKTGEPSLDKESLETYESTLRPKSKQHLFVKSLRQKRKRDTAISYLKGYKRYWQPIGEDDDWRILHGGANPTGTDTLRWSFSNPNSANVSGDEDFNLRYAFGPTPDREWWSMDGDNLEMRIPTYWAGEEDIIYVFEHPNDPPYYGSYHLLVFDLLHPQLFKNHGAKCKTLFKAIYTSVKSTNFAIIYGCQEAKADATAGVVGAFKMIRHRFPKIAKLSDRMLEQANKYGYVTTIPDKLVDPERGYPVMCTRTEYGKVLPTTPLNYAIQSTAMNWTNNGMISCNTKLKEWQARGFDAYITLQVHDQLVFSMPRSLTHPSNDYKKEKEKQGGAYFRTSNLWRARMLQRLMEESGNRINVPTTASVEYHSDNWAEGYKL